MTQTATAPVDGRPFRLEDLATAVGAETDAQLASAIGVTRRTIVRWRARGGLDPYQADRAAIAAHLHPLHVWPNWAYELTHHTP